MSTPKSIISHKPDVTVIVGSGRTKKQFQCHGTILAHASTVLDVMLSSGMKESKAKRIELPTKDPDEFKLFLECIDPASASRFRYNGSGSGHGLCWFDETNKEWREEDYYLDDLDKDGAEENGGEETAALFNPSTIFKLVRWFHEFQMDGYLKTCGDVLYESERKYGSWADKSTISEEKARVLKMLSLSIKYDLRVKFVYERKLGDLLEQFLWGRGDPDNVDMALVQEMIGHFRPFMTKNERQPKKKQRCEDGAAVNNLVAYVPSSCPTLWGQVLSCIDDDMPSYSTEDMNNGEMLAQVIYYALHRYHEQMKSQLKDVTAHFVGEKGPCHLYTTDYISVEVGKKGKKVTLSDIKEAIFDSPLIFPKFRSMEDPNAWDPGYLYRQYETKGGCCTKVYMHWEWLGDIELEEEERTNCREYEQWNKTEAVVNVTERIQSSEPDLAVLVGSGDKQQSFKCHSTILAFASSKLDSLVAASPGTLHLPHLDPGKWEGFYQSIDPRHNGDNLGDSFNDYNINCRFTSLTPWFREFEMENHLAGCQEFVRQYIKELDADDDDEKNEGKQIYDMMLLLKFLVENNFNDVKHQAELLFKKWFDKEDLFSGLHLEFVKALLSPCLPIRRSPEEPSSAPRGYSHARRPGKFTSNTCPIVFEALRSRIEDHLKTLTFDEVDTNELKMFSHLVHSYVRANEHKYS